jgi:hypothetical protein
VWALVGVVAFLLAGAAAGGFAILKMNGPKGPPAPAGQPASPPPKAAEPSPRLRPLVPAYFYPAGDGLVEWNRLLDSPAAADIMVIANTSSGPGTTADPNYARVLERARQKAITVLGYVSTSYGDRPLREVKDDVARWVNFYPGVQGIFFDEQASGPDKVSYYGTLYEYARKERGLALVVTNPGTACAEEYLARPAADVVCLVETNKDFGEYHPPAWAGRYPARCFAALLSRVGTPEQMKKNVLAMGERKVGSCYVTDGRDSNPWGRLPPYWEAEVAAVQQVNGKKAP